MDFRDLIKQTLKIVDNNPWNDFNIEHNIVIEYQDNFYVIEFTNNKCTIYPGVNNVYVYEHAKSIIKTIPNIYQLEQFSRNLYNELEYFSFEYTYPINIQDDVIKYYNKNNLYLDINQKYISFLHKKVNGKTTLIEEEYLEEFSKMLDLLTYFLNFMETKKNLLNDEKILFFNNNKVDLIKPQLFTVMLEQRIHYKTHEYKHKKNKLLRKRLIIDMRFLGPIEKEDFRIVLAAYDDTDGKILTPLGMKEINIKHISMYLDSLFEKGIYKYIEVGNIELYNILEKMLKNYDCKIQLTENQDLFDCIYEDYERIIMNNSRIQIKK